MPVPPKRAPKRHSPSAALLDRFAFPPGTELAGRYLVVRRLGRGWEGEVYLIRERATGIERAAKLFFPHRNLRNRVAKLNAKKLHQLRHCDALIQYVSQESIAFRGKEVTMLISEYVEGRLLSEFIAQQPGKRLREFEGLHLLYALARGLEPIHEQREYHGDLHDGNVIVRRAGLGFSFRFIDLFHREHRKVDSIHDDVCDLIRIFYDALGGRRTYRKHRPEVRAICCGLKRSFILKKYRNAGQLRRYLENMGWDG